MMSFFNRLQPDQVRRAYTHTALFMGIVPIWFNARTWEAQTRNGCPDWVLDVAIMFAGAFWNLERGFPITLTGEL